jgi:uncharacterized protein YecE (DUF72 family)
MAGSIRIGIAGWVFAPWRGVFYPEGLVQKKELAYAAEHLGAIEINATFRANQKPASFAKWAGEARDGFVFSIKGPQAVTHFKRLKNCEAELATFFASGPLALGPKLGPFVWQLPPNLKFDAAVLADFLALLPHTHADYVALAERTDRPQPFLDASQAGPIRHAIEARHDSFADPEFARLLTEANVARVIADTTDNPDRGTTADFIYARLQGPARPGATGYEPADLDEWAEQIRTWSDAGKDVEIHFVHEDKLHAPRNAMALMERLGLAGES